MRRFKVIFEDYGGTHSFNYFALVRTQKKGKYKFVNLSNDKILKPKFDTPSQALDWLDKWFGKGNWVPVDKEDDLKN